MSKKVDYLQELENAKIIVSGIEAVPFAVARHIVNSLIEDKVKEAVDSVSVAVQEYVNAVKMLNQDQ